MPVPVPNKTQKASRGTPGETANDGTGGRRNCSEEERQKGRPGCFASSVVAAAETKETTVPNLKTVSYWTAKPENDFMIFTTDCELSEATLILIILWCCY